MPTRVFDALCPFGVVFARAGRSGAGDLADARDGRGDDDTSDGLAGGAGGTVHVGPTFCAEAR